MHIHLGDHITSLSAGFPSGTAAFDYGIVHVISTIPSRTVFTEDGHPCAWISSDGIVNFQRIFWKTRWKAPHEFTGGYLHESRQLHHAVLVAWGIDSVDPRFGACVRCPIQSVHPSLTEISGLSLLQYMQWWSPNRRYSSLCQYNNGSQIN